MQILSIFAPTGFEGSIMAEHVNGCQNLTFNLPFFAQLSVIILLSNFCRNRGYCISIPVLIFVKNSCGFWGAVE